MSSFHNTIALHGADLAAAEAVAETQEDVVLALYRGAGRPLSPSQVWRRLTDAGHDWPLTSVRRAITELSSQGHLVQTPQMRVGLYGKPEHLWQVRMEAGA